MVNNSDSEGEAYDWSGGWRLKKKQLEDDITRKNAQLNQFMDDLQRLEEESRLQDATMATLRDRLQEATDEVDGLAADYTSIKETNDHLQDTLLAAQENEASLRAQLDEALQQKLEQQQQQTALSAAVEERLDKLQVVLGERERQVRELQEARLTEQQELREQQLKFARPAATSAVSKMQKELESKERQVLKLSSKLTQAATQLEESATIISDLKEKSKTNTSAALKEQVQQLRKQLQQERQHVSRLKLQLLSAEEDAQMHARDLASVTESLHAYMSGELSLADAVKELKACRSQLARRDTQVAQLTAMTNTLQIHVQEIMEENTQLRTQLRLEPRETLPGPGGSSTKWQNSKQTIAKLNKRIKQLEEDKINLRTEAFALMRELANQRGVVQITALEVPVREALATLAGGLGPEAEAQLREVREAVSDLGHEVHGLTSARTQGSSSDLLPMASEEARYKAQQIIEQLRREVDAVTEEAERSREEVKTQQRTLASYRKQFSALLAEVSSISAHYKDPATVMEDPSVESGQVDVTDSDQPLNDDDPSSQSGVDQQPPLQSNLQPPSLSEKSSVLLLAQQQKDDVLSHLLAANLKAVTESHDRVMAALEAIRKEFSERRIETPRRLLVPHFSRLLQEVFDERRTIIKALSQAKDLQFDTNVVLQQVQASAEHLEQMREVYTTEQTEQNVARWCQSFHKQRLANIELKEKINRISEELSKLDKALVHNEKHMEETLRKLNREDQTQGTWTRDLEVQSDNFDNYQNFATIAVQTQGLSHDEESSSMSRYEAENNVVLGQAITDLEKQRALNAILQRSLREKELTIISKEQYINKVKSELVLHKPQQQLSSDSPSVSTAQDNSSPTASSCDDKAYIEHLKGKAEESNRTIFRYQMLLEKAHKELQDETNQHKEEVTSVVRERDATLKKVKELQLCLDSIPCRDTDIGQQQHIVFVEQVQSLNETIRLLEKQLSSSRIEKSELEQRVDGLERKLKEEQQVRQHEKDRQEVACKLKSHNLELDNKRLAEQMNTLRQETENWKSQALYLKRKSSENPSILLTALVEKMREKLIEKDNYIAMIKKGH